MEHAENELLTRIGPGTAAGETLRKYWLPSGQPPELPNYHFLVRDDGERVTLVNQAPHPNAARVFINWFLSRDGQLNFQKALGKADEGSPDSMRIDISKDDVDPKSRRIDGVKYVDTE